MKKDETLKIYQLVAEIKRQARLCGSNYVGCLEAYKSDRNSIRRARREAKKQADYRWYRQDAELIPGEYYGTRLIITKNSIDYIPGQYAPTEVYWALADYFEKTKNKASV